MTRAEAQYHRTMVGSLTVIGLLSFGMTGYLAATLVPVTTNNVPEIVMFGACWSMVLCLIMSIAAMRWINQEENHNGQ